MKKNCLLSFLILALFTCNLTFAKPYTDKDPGKAPKIKGRPSVALVLSGGGALGFSQLPFMELIDELDIPIDLVIGTSVGSIIGGLYSAGYSAQQIIDEFSDVDWPHLFNDNAKSPYENILGPHSQYENPLDLTFGMDFKVNLGSGVSKGQNIYKLLKSLTLKYPSDMNFDNLPIPFRAISTNMVTGETAILHDGDIAEAIRSSMSIPGVFDPFEIEGNHYVDGWLKDNLGTDIAKKMGYDIIIAIDISSDTEKDTSIYDSNPGVAIASVLTIAQIEKVNENRAMADLVIYPNCKGFTSLDYLKSKKLFNQAKKDVDKYRIELEKIRRKIYPTEYDSTGARINTDISHNKKITYQEKDSFVVTEFKFNGIREQDKKFIERAFYRNIYNKKLSRENFENFMNRIFVTGNYIYIKPRFFNSDNITTMELTLVPKKDKTINILLGADMKQTFSESDSTSFNVNGALQLRGLTGTGSVLSLSGTCITDYKGELYFLQPFTPYLFIEFDSIFRTHNLQFNPNDKYSISELSRNKEMLLSLYAGGRTNFGNLLKLGGFFNSNRNYFTSFNRYQLIPEYSDPLYSDIEQYKNYSTGIDFIYNFSSLDEDVFPEKGFYLNINERLVFPINYNFEIGKAGLFTSIEPRVVIPFLDKFSIDIRGFFGADFLNNFKYNFLLYPVEGYSDYDRIYFPQNAGYKYSGTVKIAGALSLQFTPVKYLTVLGGKFVLRITGTAGVTALSFEEFNHPYDKSIKPRSLLWSCGLGGGLKITPQYSLYIRGGICNTYNDNFNFFFSLDLGSIKF